MNYLELHFIKSFDISVSVKKLLERYLLKRIKSLVRHFQFMVGQKHNLLGHLILARIFPVGQNVRCVFRLVGQFLILVGRCAMFDRYFKACLCYGIYRKQNSDRTWKRSPLPYCIGYGSWMLNSVHFWKNVFIERRFTI